MIKIRRETTLTGDAEILAYLRHKAKSLFESAEEYVGKTMKDGL